MITMTGSGPQLPDSLRPALHRLLADYSAVPTGAVLGCLTGCHEELSRVGVSAGLTHAADAMARTRLRHRAGAGPGSRPSPEAGRVDRDMFLPSHREALT